MTEITVIRGKNGRIVGFRGEGHSGDVPEGNNLVCASVSTVFEFLTEGASDLPDASVTFRQDSEVPSWHIEVKPGELPEFENRTMHSFLESALAVFRNLSERYPDRCRLNE